MGERDVVLDGYLHKCGVGRLYSKWTHRWCVLTSDKFTYYKDESLSEKKGQYNLSESCQITRYQGDFQGELNMICCLQRIGGSNSFELLFHTSDDATLSRWCDQIQGVIDEQRKNKTPCNILIDGLLHKCGVGWIYSQWTTRWCILTGNAFIYYEDKSLSKKKGEYKISESCEIIRKIKGAKYPNEYCLKKRGSGGYELLISADDEETITRWVELIQKVIQQHHPSTTMSVDDSQVLIRESIVSFPIGLHVSPQPFVLHLTVLRASPNVSSNCFVKVLFRSKLFGQTGMQRRNKTPDWHEHFSIPLTHLKQGQLCLEVWDHKHIGGDIQIGSVIIDLPTIPISEPIVDRGYPLISGTGVAKSSAIFVSLFVEERSDTIKLIQEQTSGVENPFLDRDVVNPTPLEIFLEEEGATIHASEKIIDAFRASDMLPLSSLSDRCFVRDVLYDVASLFPSPRICSNYDEEVFDEEDPYRGLSDGPHLLPMISYQMADNVDVIKPSDISLRSPGYCTTSDFNRADQSFSIQTEEDNIVFVAPNRFMVLMWVREIRRQIVFHSHCNSYATDIEQAYEEFHYKQGADDGHTSLEGVLQVEIRDELHDCLCTLDFETVQLKFQDLDGVRFVHFLDLTQAVSVSVAHDYALPTPMNMRVTVKAGSLTLDHKQSTKGNIADLQLRLKKVVNARTSVVVNANECCKVLRTGAVDGLMPYWNNAANFYLCQGDFNSLIGKTDRSNKACGIHIHMLMGTQGKERVLGSKFIRYSEMLSDSSNTLIDSGHDDTSPSNTVERTICLDTNFGIRVVVMGGQDLLMPPSFDDEKFSVLKAKTTDTGHGINRENIDGRATSDHNGNEKIIIQGYLNKCGIGKIYSKYTNRWCVLTSDSLVYYKDDSLALKKGEYSISDTCQINRKSEDGEHSYVCSLTKPGSGGYELLLSAENEGTMVDWFEQIQNVIDEKQDSEFRKSYHNLVAGDGVDRDPHIKMSFVTSKCLKNSHYDYAKTKKAWRTVDPHWNESFLFENSSTFPLHSAAYFQLLVLDKSRKGSKDELMGVVFIPMSEFFSDEAVSGQVIEKSFDVEAAPCMSKYVKSRYESQGLGKLHLKLQLIMESKSGSNGYLQNYSCLYNIIPPEVEITTQMQPTNEFSTYYVSDCCLRSRYCKQPKATATERVLLAPGYDSLVLLYQQSSEQKSESDEAIFARFHKKSRRRREHTIVSEENNGFQDVVVFSFFENERRSIMLEWGSQHLFKSERRKFSDESGKHVSPYEPYSDNKMVPPKGYQWDPQYETSWQIDKEYTATDDDGFCYGLDFMDVMSKLRKNQSRGRKRGRYFVRRRKWKRVAVKVEVLESDEGKASQSNNKTVHSPSRRQSISAAVTALSTKLLARGSSSQNYPDIDMFLAADDVSNVDVVAEETLSCENEIWDEDDDHSVKRVRYKIFHNQRRSLTFKWEDGHLHHGDRKIFTDETGTRDFGGPMLDDIMPPHGYRWVKGSVWTADCHYTNTDVNGWTYGNDFAAISKDYLNGESHANSGMKLVRRRRLFREMVESIDTVQECLPDRSRDNTTTSSFRETHSERVGTMESSGSRGTGSIFEDVPITKREAFKCSRDETMKLCRERASLESPIIIPNDQIKSVDVVTPSVLSIIVVVHRYFGDNSEKEETYKPVDVEIFVVECPAVRLCRLIMDRLTLLPIRANSLQLVSSGTLTGNTSIRYNDNNCLNDDGSAVALSLGCETLQRIYFEIFQAEERMQLKQGQTNRNKTIVAPTLLGRLKLYVYLLLSLGLTGPSFDVDRVAELVRADMRFAEKLHRQLTEDHDVTGVAMMNAAKQSSQLLLDAAEMRVWDYALCGWEHREDNDLQSCILILVNGYFNNLVQVLGYFFDSKDVLKSLVGNQSKLELIEFFIEYDSHLSRVVENALRPYKITADPQPNLSLALNVQELMSWYVVLLRVEMLEYVSRTFQISQNVSPENQSTVFDMPWEVVSNSSGKYISVIPTDVFNLVKQYYHIVTKFNKVCSSPEVEKEVYALNRKVREIYMECFISLVYKYQAVINRRNWVQLVELSSDDYFDDVGLLLQWLCAVANDLYHIDFEFCNGTINELSILNIESENENMFDLEKMTEHFSSVNSLSKEFNRQSSEVFHTVLDFVSIIFFQSFRDLIPTGDFQKSWCSDDNDDGLVEKIVVELIWNLSERYTNLESHCSLYLIMLCFRKFKVWYLTFIIECATLSIDSLDESFTEHIHTDCSFVQKEFFALIEKHSVTGSPDSKIIKLRDHVVQMVSNFIFIHVLLSADVESIEFQSATNALYDEAIREPYGAKGIFAFIESMMILRAKRSKGRGSVAKAEARAKFLEHTCERFKSLFISNGKSKLKLNAEPCTEYIVFDKRIPLEVYLFGDLSMSKKL